VLALSRVGSSRWSEPFAFLRMSGLGRVSTMDTDPIQDVAVQRRVIVLLGLIYVPLAILSAVFPSVSSPSVTVGFSPSEQLLGRDFSFPHSNGEGGRGKSEKEQKEKDRTRSDRTERKEGEEDGEGASTLFKYLSVGFIRAT
jgi:hypothetical protein